MESVKKGETVEIMKEQGQKGERRNDGHLPLITVVIATCNYGRFIRKAIESVLGQTYPKVELIVVDDGSTDDTQDVVRSYPEVKYLHHSQRGVSASRNAGIKMACGKYLVFLDADDWLEPAAIDDNYRCIKDSPDTAMVSGNYFLITAETNQLRAIEAETHNDHYLALLKSNYIGMLAAVLFQKWVLDEIKFDETLTACEDYDLFLNIARRYPVMQQQTFIATYFHHSSGLSHKYALMIGSIQRVIGKQKDELQTEEECAAYEQGLSQWKDYETLLAETK